MKKPVEKSCGACRACCVDLKIDTPGLQKAAHVVCPHHTGTGCGIYASRFTVCQQFLCGWRLFPELGPEWRPDQSGVLILQVAQSKLPPPYRDAGHGVQMLVKGGKDAINRPGFADCVARLTARGVAVYFSAGAAYALVNEYLAPLPPGDLDAIRRTLTHIDGLLRAARAHKGSWRMLIYLYRLQVERLKAKVAMRNIAAAAR